MVDKKGVPVMTVDPQLERDQVARLSALRDARDGDAVDAALGEVRRIAVDGGNLLHPMKRALELRATLGEVSAVLAEVFGRYRPG